MNPSSLVRRLTHRTLGTIALVMGGGAKLAESTARRFAPASLGTDPGSRVPPPTFTPQPANPGEVSPESVGAVTTSPEPSKVVDLTIDEDGRARTAESHIAELANRPAQTVVKAVANLSTEELGELFDYESTHRKRATVLSAIERAAAPDSPPDDLAYSTETPPSSS